MFSEFFQPRQKEFYSLLLIWVRSKKNFIRYFLIFLQETSPFRESSSQGALLPMGARAGRVYIELP